MAASSVNSLMKDIFRGMAEISTIAPAVHPPGAGGLPVLSELKRAGSKNKTRWGITCQAGPGNERRPPDLFAGGLPYLRFVMCRAGRYGPTHRPATSSAAGIMIVRSWAVRQWTLQMNNFFSNSIQSLKNRCLVCVICCAAAHSGFYKTKKLQSWFSTTFR